MRKFSRLKHGVFGQTFTQVFSSKNVFFSSKVFQNLLLQTMVFFVKTLNKFSLLINEFFRQKFTQIFSAKKWRFPSKVYTKFLFLENYFSENIVKIKCCETRKNRSLKERMTQLAQQQRAKR